MRTRILIEIPYSGTTWHIASEDLEFPSSSQAYYEGRLIDSDNISESLTDVYYGSKILRPVTFTLDNTDGRVREYRDAYEFRGETVTIKRVNLDSDAVIESNEFIIDKIELDLKKAKFTTIIEDVNIFETHLPKHKLTDDIFPNLPDEDKGRYVPIILGSMDKVSCYLINENMSDDYYDYLVGYGTIFNVVTVYRGMGDNAETVGESEYDWYDGDQVFSSGAATSTKTNYLVDDSSSTDFTSDELQVGDDVHNTTKNTWTTIKSIPGGGNEIELDDDIFLAGDSYEIAPYMGYAFIRFGLQQTDNGNHYNIRCDVGGIEGAGGTNETNPANQLRMIMENSTYGLNINCNDASFDAAAAILTNWSMAANAWIGEPRKASDIIDDFLMSCRVARLKRGTNGYEIKIDDSYPDSSGFSPVASFNKYNMNVLSDHTIPASEYVKRVIVNGDYNPYYDSYRGRAEYDTGKNFGVIKEYNIPYAFYLISVYRIAAYLKNKFLYQDRKIAFMTGTDASALTVDDIIEITYSDFGLDGDLFQIMEISKSANKYKILAAEYNEYIYDYP